MADLLRLPKLFRERAAAAALGISPATLRRMRSRGEIGFVMIGRRPCYTEDILAAYIASKTTTPCDAAGPNDLERSGATGSACVPTAPSGAGPGSMPAPDRLAAHRSVQMILSRRS